MAALRHARKTPFIPRQFFRKRGHGGGACRSPARAFEPVVATLAAINNEASRLVEASNTINVIGASTSVITADDIRRSPGQTVKRLWARYQAYNSIVQERLRNLDSSFGKPLDQCFVDFRLFVRAHKLPISNLG